MLYVLHALVCFQIEPTSTKYDEQWMGDQLMSCPGYVSPTFPFPATGPLEHNIAVPSFPAGVNEPAPPDASKYVCCTYHIDTR